jgi:hypothetical protein
LRLEAALAAAGRYSPRFRVGLYWHDFAPRTGFHAANPPRPGILGKTSDMVMR